MASLNETLQGITQVLAAGNPVLTVHFNDDRWR